MIKKEILDKIKPGAKVRIVHDKITFEGLVIARKHGKEAGATFTVRAIVGGVGVEKIFPINSPLISDIQIISSPKKVHRSKLYFIRKFSGSKIRQRLKVTI